MPLLPRAIEQFVRDEEGATMAEYALLLALIAVVVIVGAKALGSNVNNRLTTTGTSIATGG